jgi:hypothetical protein
MNTMVAAASIALAIYAHTYIKFYYGKTIPVQAWTGPEGSSRSRLPDFKTVSTRRPKTALRTAP